MLDVKTRPLSEIENRSSERVITFSVMVFQVVAVVIFLIVGVLGFRTARLPFVGAFFGTDMEITEVTPFTPEGWAVYQAGLGDGNHRLVLVDEYPINSASDYYTAVNAKSPGDLVSLTVEDQSGLSMQLDIALGRLPILDQFVYFYFPYLIGLIFLVCGIWVISLRRHSNSGRTFAVFATTMALVLGGFFDQFTTHSFTYIWFSSFAVSSGALLSLSMVFPQPLKFLRKHGWIRWLPVLFGVMFAVMGISALAEFTLPWRYSAALRVVYAFSAVAIFVFLLIAAIRGFKLTSPIAKEQTGIILFGAFTGFAPIGVWMFLAAFRTSVGINPLFLLPLAVFPITTAYAILRYRILQTDYILSRGLVYSILMLLTVTIFGLLIWGAALIFQSSLNITHPITIAIMVFLLTVGFNPIQQYLQKQVDRVFFRGESVYQEALIAFSRDLTKSFELEQVIGLLSEGLSRSLQPEQLHIFLYDVNSDQYVSSILNGAQPTTDIRFPATSALAGYLGAVAPSLYLSETGELSKELASDYPRFALLGTRLFVAFPGQKRLAGWLALGNKRSGAPYTRRDVDFAEALADQASLAIERAQGLHNLEVRVRQMNVLARVAQGINVTLNFDDILELIFAQTARVIAMHYMAITLYDKETGTFSHAFYLENNERIPDRERKSIPLGLGLEQEVVRRGRPIRTDDYEYECRSQGVIPSVQGLYAWQGVPLNTGKETIGVISIGSCSPDVLYTTEQQALVQAIGDQAAGAIVKAQLLIESERRAKQMSSLNDVSRSLTSTLDYKSLMNQILTSAIDILESEAGTLFLLDQQTGEFIFEAAVGPVAENLLGTRLQPGTGFVGKAASSRKSIMVNNVQSSTEWYAQTDQDTGFTTRAMLIQPILLREQVIGVVEVLNKSDRSPFNADDERLLAAFTAQSAIAIQNSRLFTMTDQALADRVEELSIMQRIDRELNTSLSVENAIKITLEWSIRQAAASAAVGAILDYAEDGSYVIRVVTAQGNPADATLDELGTMLSSHSLITQAIKTGKYQFVILDGDPGSPLRPDTQSLLVQPIRRMDETLSFLFLERQEPDLPGDEALAFMQRLSDHAAIAVANAQLYEEVQEANIAKSEFVSFVSHELKTPMTSIRGYTDLILAGAVGPVSESQKGFLGTIRANVDRMGTLVSDLADVSRIESGRLRLDFGAVSIQELIDQVMQAQQSQIDEKEQQVEISIPDFLPMAWVDKDRTIQVLTNMVSNAYKYTPQGGRITIRVKKVSNQWDPGGAPEVLLIAVQDTGIGIAPEDQKKIFTKFFRSEDQKARESPGTGLGLNITKNLVELQGGRIWFESEFREGTTFFFTLPVSAGDGVTPVEKGAG